MDKSIAQTVPVLMYHHVTPKGGSLSCSVRNFEAQMKYLAKHEFTTLSAEQFAGFLQGQAIPRRSVLLTFDDGYLNNFVYAHPILKKYNQHALMFLITGLMQEGEPRPIMGSGDDLPECPGHHECKQRIIEGRADEVMLRWSEVKAMRESGTFEFHSHTHTHIRWDLHENKADKNQLIHDDLRQSQEQLAIHLEINSNHLCWPQGYFNPDYIQVAQELGFKHLYTTEAYGFNLPHGPAEHIYRIAARNKGGPWLLHRLWWARHLRWGQWYNEHKLKKKQRRLSKR